MKKTIKSGDLTLSYREVNSEREFAIVFIHGNSQSSLTFESQLSCELLSSFRLLSVDLPGHGFSTPAHHSIPELVRAIKTFVSVLDLSEYVMVGHSLGGHLILQALEDLEPRGIFLSGTPPLSKPMDGRGFRPHPLFGLLYQESVTDSDLQSLMSDLYNSVEGRNLGIAEFRQTDPKFRPALLRSIIAEEFTDEIASWNEYQGAKKLIIGRQDKVIDGEIVSGIIQETILVSGGHNIHLENSKEYNALLSEFMGETIRLSNKTFSREESING